MTKQSKKTNPEREIQFREMYDVVSASIHGAKIQRGKHLEKVIADTLKAKFPMREILREVGLPSASFKKSGKHKVDVVMIDHDAKTVLLISSKSAGISNTDPKNNIGIPQMMEAWESAKTFWPGYTIDAIVLRTSGEKIKEWEDAGLHTYKTDDYLGGDSDVMARVAEAVRKDLAANMKKNIERACMKDPAQIRTLLELVQVLCQPIIK